MRQEISNNLITPNDIKISPESHFQAKKEKEIRYRFIDYARGFIMLWLVIGAVFPPGEWRDNNAVLFWLFGHPGSHDKYMTLYDVGAAAFIFVIGLSFSISFYRHREKQGTIKAVSHILFRYTMIFILGLIILLADGSDLVYESEGLQVVAWDVIPTLGFVGFVTLPFVFIKRSDLRMIIGYIWIFIYQILMNFAGLKAYAQASVHGGIYGTIFGYSGIMIIATALGDYIFNTNIQENKKYRNIGIFGLMNLILGILIAYIPEWEAAKRQVSFTHCLISLGVSTLGILLFAYFDKGLQLKITYLEALGKNPFLTYLIAETPVFILDLTIGDDLGLGPWGNVIVLFILLTYTSIILLWLYRKEKVIPTEKIAGTFIIIAIPLALILYFLGVF